MKIRFGLRAVFLAMPVAAGLFLALAYWLQPEPARECPPAIVAMKLDEGSAQYAGTWQRIEYTVQFRDCGTETYVDQKPFGSLDEVRVDGKRYVRADKAFDLAKRGGLPVALPVLSKRMIETFQAVEQRVPRAQLERVEWRQPADTRTMTPSEQNAYSKLGVLRIELDRDFARCIPASDDASNAPVDPVVVVHRERGENDPPSSMVVLHVVYSSGDQVRFADRAPFGDLDEVLLQSRQVGTASRFARDAIPPQLLNDFDRIGKFVREKTDIDSLPWRDRYPKENGPSLEDTRVILPLPRSLDSRAAVQR